MPSSKLVGVLLSMHMKEEIGKYGVPLVLNS